jgi:hypothetical protein
MSQVDGCCQHGELLDKYCPECAKEDREAEKKEFDPKEGDRILVGWTEDKIDYERTYIYTDKRGKFICVDSANEAQYRKGNYYVAQSWLCAKPLPPKLPEFIQGDPIIVWGGESAEYIRIVDHVDGNGNVKCFADGAFHNFPLTPSIDWSHYKPLLNYNYGSRDVWGSEDKK